MNNTISLNRSSQIQTVMVIALVSLAVLLSWLQPLTSFTTESIESSLKQAGIAFGFAKVLNGLVSVMQSTELQVSLGAGMSIAIGEILDPFNDLIEDYSTLMKFALGSLIVQTVLIKITSNFLFNLLLTLSASFFLITLWLKRPALNLLAFRLFIFTFALRFLLIFSLLMNHWIDQQFIQPETQQKMAQVAATTEEEQQKLQQLSQVEPPATQEQSFIDSLTNKVNGWKQTLSASMQQVSNALDIQQLSTKLDRIGMDLITLMSLFLLKTLLLPLLILWLLLKLTQQIWQLPTLPFTQPNETKQEEKPHDHG